MPFSDKHNIQKNFFRKEYMDFSIAHHSKTVIQSIHISPFIWKRASVSTFLFGSVTVEASLILPVFCIALVCILSVFEVQTIKMTVRSGLQCAGQKVAYEDYGREVFVPFMLESDLVNAIGKERLEGSSVEGGSGGISCFRSFRDPSSHKYTFIAEYKVKLPFSLFGVPPVKQIVRLEIKGWNGYQDSENDTDSVIVYVTETGAVYHRNAHCSYLDLTIHTASLESIGNKRNRYQGKYRPCERCGIFAAGTVYITDMGNRYHSNIHCSGLKRQVRAIRLKEVGERRPCSRCGY